MDNFTVAFGMLMLSVLIGIAAQIRAARMIKKKKHDRVKYILMTVGSFFLLLAMSIAGIAWYEFPMPLGWIAFGGSLAIAVFHTQMVEWMEKNKDRNSST